MADPGMNDDFPPLIRLAESQIGGTRFPAVAIVRAFHSGDVP